MHKYFAKKTTVDGITFDSKAEARRYKELVSLQKSGKIADLELQPRFLLQEKFRYQGKTYRDIAYVADFLYCEKETNKLIVEDVKGVETDVFKLKRKLFLKKYGSIYEFRIVKM